MVFLSLFLLAACNGKEEKMNEKNKNMNTKPTHAADANYYIEPFRPQYHFSPEEGNLADPNGLVFFEGEYHQFYQQNGQWAHAISTDLLHWKHLPIALSYDELGQSISGSAVVDWKDTSGFFGGKPGLVAIFTNTKEGIESQSLAYSKDNGRTWEKYKGNPIIQNPGIKDFRDPKVFWHQETKKWVMVVSTNQSVSFYGSSDLKKWKFLSKFGEDQGSHAAVWECPDLFQLPVDGNSKNKKWVLHVSVGDNAETNGSTAQYFIGEFDGKHFLNDNKKDTVLWTDFGKDFYAAQSYSDLPTEDGRRIWQGWMSNWRYPYQSPTKPWMGSMSIPREVSLQTIKNEGIRLVQRPIKELESLRVDEIKLKDIVVDGNKQLDQFSGTTFEFEGVLEWEHVEEFGIRLRQSNEEETVIGYESNGPHVFMNRTNSGLQTILDRSGHEFTFGNKYTAPYSPEKKSLKIHGFVDESSVEIFINDGEQVFTNLIYTKSTNGGVELYSKGGSVTFKSLKLYHLQSTWRKKSESKHIERIVVNEQSLDLKVGESKEMKAAFKPDWVKDEGNLIWKLQDPGLVEIKDNGNGNVQMKGLQSGSTEIQVSDPSGRVSTSINVYVFD